MDNKAPLRRKSHRITQILATTYGSPSLNNKSDPLDELIFIILSLMTTAPSYNRVFDQLKAAIPDWDAARSMPTEAITSLIKNAGLSQQKSVRINQILNQIYRDFGQTSLEALRKWPDTKVEEYLTKLNGVGEKTAKCVMLFSLGRRVLPIDVNVWRVSARLGLIHEKITSKHVHHAAEYAVRPGDRYQYHVNALAHGRTLCLALRPRCKSCPLLTMCPYGRCLRRASGGHTTSAEHLATSNIAGDSAPAIVTISDLAPYA